jgi:hypothetical protein
MGVLSDQHHHSEVVKEFEGPDHALPRLLTVRARRLPQRATQLSPTLPSGG